MSELESDFVLEQHGCMCISMGNKWYALHYQIVFVPPRKPGCFTKYNNNPTHGNIAVNDQQYQNNIHHYHLVKTMNSSLKKIIITAINDQWVKGTEDMGMGM